MLYCPMKSGDIQLLKQQPTLMEFQAQPYQVSTEPIKNPLHMTPDPDPMQINEKIFSLSLKSANGLQLVCFGIFLRQGVLVIRWYSKAQTQSQSTYSRSL